MAEDIPIDKVKPTHSSTKLVKFTNIDSEDFIHALGGKKYKFEKGKSIMLAENLAFHFAKNLAQKIIFRDDDSLKKYADIDEKLNRKKTAKGETPIIKGVSREAVSEVMTEILNGYKMTKDEDSEVTDASEIGVEVKKSEDKPKESKSNKSRKEEEEDEFEGLDD